MILKNEENSASLLYIHEKFIIQCCIEIIWQLLSFTFSLNRYNSVDVNVAVATDAGLITPIVSRADIKVGHLV